MWTSADTRAFTAPNGAPGAPPITSIGSGPLAAGTATSASAAQSAILGVNGTGTAKVQPQVIGSFARLYFGGDGMATNGLRYGAAIEIRENFSGQPSGASASTYSSLETLYVRRAFTYVAGDNWGIVRAGQADGLIGIFDNGVTTFQFLPTGNFNGGDSQSFMPGSCAAHVDLAIPGGRRVRQHQGCLHVAADRRVRLRHSVCAEHLERLRLG